MRKRLTGKFVVVMVVVCVIVALILVPACAPKAAPAPPASAEKKPDSVPLALLVDVTGPYAPVAKSYHPGFVDAIEYINTKLGGVKGVPMSFVERDDGGKVAVVITNYEEIRVMNPRPYIMHTCGSYEAEPLHDRFADDKFPAILAPTTIALYPAAYSFGIYPTYPDQFGAFVDWLMSTWKEARAPKVAFLTWDSPYGKACLTDEAYAYAKTKGVDIVRTELFGMRDMDVSTQLLRIREKNPDWIFSNTSIVGPKVIFQSAKDMGYEIKLAGAVGLEWLTMRMTGPQLLEGAIVVAPWVNWDDPQSEGVKAIKQIFDKNGRTESDRDQCYLHAWSFVTIAHKVISKAVDEVGWGKVDGTVLKDQLCKLNNFRFMEGFPVISYTKERPSPLAMRVYQIRGGKMVPLSDWKDAPDLRPAQYK